MVGIAIHVPLASTARKAAPGKRPDARLSDRDFWNEDMMIRYRLCTKVCVCVEKVMNWRLATRLANTGHNLSS